MRLTSAMWFAVFMRLETNRGAYVSVAKPGAQQAGAIFVIQNHLDGTFSLFSPAPQSFLSENQDDDRHFECVKEKAGQQEIDDYMDKQIRFDPDLWIVESESGSGEISLSIAND